jgi:hypothetical protein
MNAESHPTKGFALRPFWHCTSTPSAPHLSEKVGYVVKEWKLRILLNFKDQIIKVVNGICNRMKIIEKL